MQLRLLTVVVIILSACHANAAALNVSYGVDTSDKQIHAAIRFLDDYISKYANRQQPDYKYYWSAEDNKRAAIPDDMTYAISSDGATYRFGNKTTVFYARAEDGIVHLKTLIASADTGKDAVVWAIMNHYVMPGSDHPRFISEVCLHKSKYRTVKNGNINYHFPATTPFSKAKSDHLLQQTRKLEHDWGFKPANVNYYYARDAVSLAQMRGFDYVFNMCEQVPSGISQPEDGIIYCQGLGEGYLHEVLHLYFNPLYEKSPMCHPLIYYLAGGMGKDFNWMIHRMNEYLAHYPETDLAQYDTIISKDPMLHIDYVTKGLLCKIIDEKDGRAGLKRALQYKTSRELLQAEFGVTPQTTNDFLRAEFRKYDSGEK